MSNNWNGGLPSMERCISNTSHKVLFVVIASDPRGARQSRPDTRLLSFAALLAMTQDCLAFVQRYIKPIICILHDQHNRYHFEERHHLAGSVS